MPKREERHKACTRKRRYRAQGDTLDAAMVAGIRQTHGLPVPFVRPLALGDKPVREC